LDDPSAPPVLAFSFRAQAWDVSGQHSEVDIPLFLAKRPVIEKFSDIRGGLGGYQPFTVRGRYFLEGSLAFIDGIPIVSAGAVPGGDRHDDQTIMGWTPPRARPGPVFVQVRSPVATATADLLFTYIGPPRPRDIQPPMGPSAGGIRVTVRGNDLRTGVVVLIGPSTDARRPLYNVSYDAENKVVGCLPPGNGVASVWAYDPMTGDGSLVAAFTYLPPGAPAPPPDPYCM
jgi:hypothetical protein